MRSNYIGAVSLPRIKAAVVKRDVNAPVIRTASGAAGPVDPATGKPIAELRAILATLSDAMLMLVTKGIDPEGGTVPQSVVELAREEAARRGLLPNGAKGIDSKTLLVGAAVVGLLVWKMT